MAAIKKEFSTALADNLSKLDEALDAYIAENPDLYAEHLWQPLWEKQHLDFRADLLAKTAWIKVCMDNLNNPAEQALWNQYRDKLTRTINTALPEIMSFAKTPRIGATEVKLCEQVAMQLKELDQQIL